MSKSKAAACTDSVSANMGNHEAAVLGLSRRQNNGNQSTSPRGNTSNNQRAELSDGGFHNSGNRSVCAKQILGESEANDDGQTERRINREERHYANSEGF